MSGARGGCSIRDAIPTRYSVYDLDFDAAFANRLAISVNDIHQPFVVAYDIDAGTVVRYVTDAAGHLFIDRDTKQVVTEEVRGEVVVVLKPS